MAYKHSIGQWMERHSELLHPNEFVPNTSGILISFMGIDDSLSGTSLTLDLQDVVQPFTLKLVKIRFSDSVR